MPQARFHIIWLFIFNASLIILTPLIRGPGNYLAFTLIFLSTNLLLLSFIWQAIKTGTIKIVLSSLSILSFVFLGIILYSFFFTINPPSTRYGFFTMASVIINGVFLSFVSCSCPFMGVVVKEEPAHKNADESATTKSPILEQRLWQWLCFILVITISVLSAMALYQYTTGHSNFAGRAHATFVNPNSFSGYLLLTIPVLIGLYLSPSPSRGGPGWGWGIKHFPGTYILFLLNLLSFAALLATGTGGRWIFLAAAVGVALLLFWIFAPIHSSPIPPLAKSPSFPPLKKGDEGGLKGGKGGFEKWRNVKTRLIVLFLGFLSVLLIFLLPVGNGNVSFSPKPAEISGSTQDRLNIWKSTLEVIKEHPIRGVGFWSFHTIYSKYKSRIYKNVEHYFSHNDYLQLWAELGLLGVGVFLLLILFYFREGLRCLKAVSLDVVGEGLVPSQRETTRISPTHRTMLLSTLIGSFLLLVHTIGDFDLYIPSILFLFWGYIAYASSTASELGLCKPPHQNFWCGGKTKIIDLNSFRIFTTLGKKKLYIITIGIFAFLSFWVSDPYLAGLYNERGKDYLATGEYEKAVKFFNKAVELDSIDDSYHFNFGLALAKSSNDPLILKRAEDEMRKAIAIAPYRSDIYFNLANFYREFYLKEKGDIAVTLMKKARELDPLDAAISHNLGVLYMQLGMYKDAIDEFKRYLEEEPNDADAHVEMSGAYRMNKEYDNAIKELDWLLSKNATNNYAHFLKANILMEMKQYDGAYSEYQLALREKGKESEVWYEIGLLHLKQNKPKEAEEAFRKAVDYRSLDQKEKRD